MAGQMWPSSEVSKVVLVSMIMAEEILHAGQASAWEDCRDSWAWGDAASKFVPERLHNALSIFEVDSSCSNAVMHHAPSI